MIQTAWGLFLPATRDALDVVTGCIALRANGLVEDGSMSILRMYFVHLGRSGLVAIRRPRNLLLRAALDNLTVVTWPSIIEI